jgi:hypothetical protein
LLRVHFAGPRLSGGGAPFWQGCATPRHASVQPGWFVPGFAPGGTSTSRTIVASSRRLISRPRGRRSPSGQAGGSDRKAADRAHAKRLPGTSRPPGDAVGRRSEHRCYRRQEIRARRQATKPTRAAGHGVASLFVHCCGGSASRLSEPRWHRFKRSGYTDGTFRSKHNKY